METFRRVVGEKIKILQHVSFSWNLVDVNNNMIPFMNDMFEVRTTYLGGWRCSSIF